MTLAFQSEGDGWYVFRWLFTPPTKVLLPAARYERVLLCIQRKDCLRSRLSFSGECDDSFDFDEYCGFCGKNSERGHRLFLLKLLSFFLRFFGIESIPRKASNTEISQTSSWRQIKLSSSRKYSVDPENSESCGFHGRFMVRDNFHSAFSTMQSSTP